MADSLWLFVAKARGGEYWVGNAACEIDSITIGDLTWPLTLAQAANQPASYVLDPCSAWIHYPQAELSKHHRWPVLRPMFDIVGKALLSPMHALICGARLPQTVTIANKLISTNLFPDWQTNDLAKLKDQLVERFPNRPLMLRNVCPALHPMTFQALREQGWRLIPARIVYLCDTTAPGLWKHNHIKKDLKLMHDKQVDIITPLQLQRQHAGQLRQLFRDLFILKHSVLNPDFTPAFFEMCLETGFLELFALRYQNRLVGVLGLYDFLDPQTGHRWLTTPLIGYDTHLPVELGLYRRLMALLLSQAAERGAQLHYSSGAGSFKRVRGGRPHLEYSAVYARHLPPLASASLDTFTTIMNVCAPNLLHRAENLSSTGH